PLKILCYAIGFEDVVRIRHYSGRSLHGCADSAFSQHSDGTQADHEFDLGPRSTRTLTIRRAACPSHNGGAPLGRGGSFNVRSASSTIRFGSVPITRLVPQVTVAGRSVLSRSVKQGTPRIVVSSWIPPESVRTR